jgi:hypothetical protein
MTTFVIVRIAASVGAFTRADEWNSLTGTDRGLQSGTYLTTLSFHMTF